MLVASAIAGWFAVLIVVGAAFSGVLFRRWWKYAPFIRRMRPHYVLGYGALAIALIHVFVALALTSNAEPTGIKYATVALGVLGVQTFVGASLQDPGSYRGILRTWHLLAFGAIVILGAIHVIANGAIL